MKGVDSLKYVDHVIGQIPPQGYGEGEVVGRKMA